MGISLSKNIVNANKLVGDFADIFAPGNTMAYSEAKISSTAPPLIIRSNEELYFVKLWSLRGFFEIVKNFISLTFFGKDRLKENSVKAFELVQHAKCDLLKLKAQLQNNQVPADTLADQAKKINRIGAVVEAVLADWFCDSPSRSAASHLINFGATKKIEGGSSREENLHKKYDGQNITAALLHGYQQAVDYFASNPQDTDTCGLMRIIEHRRILCEVARDLNNSHALVHRVSALADPQSDQVVHLKDGAAFSIPGGSSKHYVTYEVKCLNDKYYFYIHNRGKGLADKDLHGSLQIIDQGIKYQRTSVCIEVSREHLSGDFFKELVESAKAPDMQTAYAAIKRRLLHTVAGGRKGRIIISEEEKLIIKLKNQPDSNNNVLMNALAVLIRKNIFHPVQVYGTCTESNKSTPEIYMCDKKTRMRLKQFSVQKLVDKVAHTRFGNTNDQRELIALGKKRICDLRKKIACFP